MCVLSLAPCMCGHNPCMCVRFCMCGRACTPYMFAYVLVNKTFIIGFNNLDNNPVGLVLQTRTKNFILYSFAFVQRNKT